MFFSCLFHVCSPFGPENQAAHRLGHVSGALGSSQLFLAVSDSDHSLLDQSSHHVRVHFCHVMSPASFSSPKSEENVKGDA